MLEELFQVIALRVVEHLQGLTRRRPFRPRAYRKVADEVRVDVELLGDWLAMRVARTRWIADDCPDPEKDEDPPPYATQIKQALTRWGVASGSPGKEESWTIPYGRASILAVPLLPMPRYGDKRGPFKSALLPERSVKALRGNHEHSSLEDGLERAAVHQLEQFAHAEDKTEIASHRDWIAGGDPDLGGLRARRAFRDWARIHLGADVDDLTLKPVDGARVTIEALGSGAEQFVLVWLDRASQQSVGAAEWRSWWRAEKDAWELVGQVCRAPRERRSRANADSTGKSAWQA